MKLLSEVWNNYDNLYNPNIMGKAPTRKIIIGKYVKIIKKIKLKTSIKVNRYFANIKNRNKKKLTAFSLVRTKYNTCNSV